ncbi:hypothetical protein BaRGS_00026066 [Batillaria attramentaria]|uniref:Uncharacterized protein n=1 Tax=Batillaria attramentaria TaxID=370345 RepID=A0ABD0K740_9CAEN
MDFKRSLARHREEDKACRRVRVTPEGCEDVYSPRSAAFPALWPPRQHLISAGPRGWPYLPVHGPISAAAIARPTASLHFTWP